MSSDPRPPAPPQVQLVTPVWAIVLVAVGGFFGFIMILGVLVALLLPAVQAAREAARRAQCVSNLKQIGVALQSYHDTYQTFPPAYLADGNGRPMHSWRVLLLPFFEDAEASAIYDEYDFNEPWDGPNNSKLAGRRPRLFTCPSGTDFAGETNYVAVVGDETFWPGGTGVSIRRITDGTSNTIAVAETVRQDIGWTEPRDLTLDEALNTILPPAELGSLTAHPGGANVLFADGSVHFLEDSTPPEMIRALLTVAGGERVDWDALSR